MTVDVVEALKNVSLFSLMKKGDLKKIAKNCQVHEYAAGDVITSQGELDGRLFVLITGQVRVVKDLGNEMEREVAKLGHGSYFGEMALVDDFRRTATVLAEEPSVAISLDQWNFRDSIAKYPSVAVEMLQNMARRLRDSEAQVC